MVLYSRTPTGTDATLMVGSLAHLYFFYTTAQEPKVRNYNTGGDKQLGL